MKHNIIKNAPNCEVFHQNIALSTVTDSRAELNVFLLGKHLFNLCMLLMMDPLCGVKRLTNRETPKAGCTDSTCALQPNLDFLFHLARFSHEMDACPFMGRLKSGLVRYWSSQQCDLHESAIYRRP